MIRVQQDDFDVGAELAALCRDNPRVGGLASFIGLVREQHVREGMHRDSVQAMTLEHWPGVTEQALTEIDEEAHRRWPLEATLVVHRYGRLVPGDRIVLVAVASAHREAAFEACQFLIDWLKTKAPFWKLEDTDKGAAWVGAHTSDDEAAARWERK
jgi:molybdopterin synthase catalytic subunit